MGVNVQDQNERIQDTYWRLAESAGLHQLNTARLDIDTPDRLAQARSFVNACLDAGLIGANELARRCDLHPPDVSVFRHSGEKPWPGRPGTLYNIATRLIRGLDQFIREQRTGRDLRNAIAETRFTQEVRGVVQYCIRRNKLGAFVAPAGSGKSTVLRAIQAEMPWSILIEGRNCRARVGSFLQAWARACGLQPQGRNHELEERIIQALAGTGWPVLIDEAHKLTVTALDTIREVWDGAKCPIVLAGTPSLHTALTRGRADMYSLELMSQLYSRIAIFRDLTTIESPNTGKPAPLFTLDDIGAVFNRGAARLRPDGAEFLAGLANSPGAGGLRTCRDLVDLLSDLYPDEPVTSDRLQSVFALKIGARDAADWMRLAGARMVRTPAKVAAG